MQGPVRHRAAFRRCSALAPLVKAQWTCDTGSCIIQELGKALQLCFLGIAGCITRLFDVFGVSLQHMPAYSAWYLTMGTFFVQVTDSLGLAFTPLGLGANHTCLLQLLPLHSKQMVWSWLSHLLPDCNSVALPWKGANILHFPNKGNWAAHPAWQIVLIGKMFVVPSLTRQYS
jgi:hypothetical protein